MKQSVYLIIFCVLVFSQTACGQIQQDDSDSKSQVETEETKKDYPNLRLQAEELSKATVNSDFAKVVDLTYPKIVDGLGGKEKMIARLKNEFPQAEGYKFESQIVGEIKQVVKIDNELFAVVPIKIILKTPDEKLLAENSVVGISNDKGINWKFVDANEQEKFNRMFPKVADKIQIPMEQLPKPIEN